MKIGQFLKKKAHIWIIALCVLSFLMHMVVLKQFRGWFCTDMDEYWLHAATFTAHDWSGVADKLPIFYSWGYGLFLTIPFVISDDILIMSQIAVVMNSLFCALTIPLLYSIGKCLMKDMDKKVIMASAFITSLYSAYFLKAAVALPESLLLFLYVLLLWLLLKYMDTQKKCWAVLGALCCGYIYIVHHEMIGIVIAFMLMSVIQYVHSRDWKEMICFVVPLVFMLLVDVGVSHWLELKETASDAYTVYTNSSMEKQLDNLFSFKGIISIVQNVIGEVWYLLAGTFTIAGWGILTVVRNIKKGVEGHHKNTEDEKNYLPFYCYVVLAFLAMIAVSVVVGYRDTTVSRRIDLVFWGSYFENTIIILVFIGLIRLSRIWEEKKAIKDAALLLVAVVSTSVLVHYFAKGLGGDVINHFSVTAVLFPFSHPNLHFSVVASSICMITLAIVFIYLLLRKEKEYRLAAYVLIAGSFCYIGYNAVDNVKEIYKEEASIVNFPVYNEEFNMLDDYISYCEAPSVYVYAGDGYQAFAYQLFHPDVKIVAVSSEEEILGGECEYVILPRDIAVDWEQVETLMELNTYLIGKIW